MYRSRARLMLPIVLVVVVVGFGLFQARNLLVGPQVTVLDPTPGSTITGPTYVIRGTVRNVAHLSINGHPIMTNLEGAFEETRVTPEGLGVILIEADDRFGRRTEVRMEIWGKPS